MAGRAFTIVTPAVWTYVHSTSAKQHGNVYGPPPLTKISGCGGPEYQPRTVWPSE